MGFDPYLRPECPHCGARVPWKLLNDRHEFPCPECRVKLCSTFRVWRWVAEWVSLPLLPLAAFAWEGPHAFAWGFLAALVVLVILGLGIRVFGQISECERS